MAVTAVTIGKLIEGHLEKDEKKFLAYANFIADEYEKTGDERAARIIRERLDGSYKAKPKLVVLDE
jgi:hypothetical protein